VRERRCDEMTETAADGRGGAGKGRDAILRFLLTTSGYIECLFCYRTLNISFTRSLGPPEDS